MTITFNWKSCLSVVVIIILIGYIVYTRGLIGDLRKDIVAEQRKNIEQLITKLDKHVAALQDTLLKLEKAKTIRREKARREETFIGSTVSVDSLIGLYYRHRPDDIGD